MTLKEKYVESLPNKFNHFKSHLLEITKELWSASSAFKGVGQAAIIGGAISGITSAAMCAKNN